MGWWDTWSVSERRTLRSHAAGGGTPTHQELEVLCHDYYYPKWLTCLCTLIWSSLLQRSNELMNKLITLSASTLHAVFLHLCLPVRTFTQPTRPFLFLFFPLLVLLSFFLSCIFTFSPPPTLSSGHSCWCWLVRMQSRMWSSLVCCLWPTRWRQEKASPLSGQL